jgi:hypothetical protein
VNRVSRSRISSAVLASDWAREHRRGDLIDCEYLERLSANLTSSSFAEAVDSRPSIRDASSSRVRIDADNFLAMLLCRAAKPVAESHCKGCTPPNFQQP